MKKDSKMEAEPAVMRSKIIETAMELFVAQGYDGISMREIAAACGLSKPGLYYYFTDKQALFLAILEDQLSGLEITLKGITAQPGNTRKKIHAFLLAIFSQSTAQSAIIRLASQDMSKVEAELRAAFNLSYHAKFLDPLATLLQTGINSSELRTFEPQYGVWALLGLVYPYLSHPFSSSLEKERTIAFIETVLFEGISTK
jgi:AcrR family transcriptional regulator